MSSDHATTTAIEEAEHGTIKSFTVVWIILLFFTGIEVLLAYEQVTPVIMLVILIGLSVIKAALIIAYFMHLKFERFSLFLTLFPMLIFCILMMLVFMPDSMRSMLMRTQ
jgi:cytochrome c oxidase subunit IV